MTTKTRNPRRRHPLTKAVARYMWTETDATLSWNDKLTRALELIDAHYDTDGWNAWVEAPDGAANAHIETIAGAGACTNCGSTIERDAGICAMNYLASEIYETT